MGYLLPLHAGLEKVKRTLYKYLLSHALYKLVDKFCYLGDVLSVDGDADAAVEARIRIGWNKFRQLVPLLTNKTCL